MATVAEIWRYPVKSMQGERVGGADLDERGVPGDRRFGVVDAESGRVLSGKREGRLLEATARWHDGEVTITLPDGTECHSADAGVSERLSAWLGRPVRLEAADPGQPRAYEMNVDNVDENSPVIEIPCPPGTFLDAGAVHLLTTASLRAAAALHPEGQWAVGRFRPTVLVEADGADWTEDAWIGMAIAIGVARLTVFAPTVRCAIPTRAQDGLVRDLDIARTLNHHHGSNLGVYAAVSGPGRIEEGDEVEPART